MSNLSTATEVASPLAIVTINNGEAVTTSLVIAELLERPHHGVIQLVRTHESALNKFGSLTFEQEQSEAFQMPRGAIKPVAIAILNEQQATLLISFMSNSANYPLLRSVFLFSTDQFSTLSRSSDLLHSDH